MIKNMPVHFKLTIEDKRPSHGQESFFAVQVIFDAKDFPDMERQIKAYIRDYNKKHKLMKLARFTEAEHISRFYQ